MNKKSAKKTTKKSVKKTAKKSVKKTAKKSVKKTAPKKRIPPDTTNHCPRCGSTNLDWQTTEVEGNDASQNSLCEICGCEWVSCFKFTENIITAEPDTQYYSINMIGRSAFINTQINIDPDCDDTDELLQEAHYREIIDKDDAKEIFNITKIDIDEYRRAMGDNDM